LTLDFNIPNTTLLQAKKGNKDALCSLYNGFSKAMFNICIRMLGNREMAEDVLQEIFMIAFKNLHQINNENAFAGWIKRITINECIRASKAKINYKEFETKEFDFLQDDETSWWQNVDLATINNLIKELPNGCRQIFNLFAVENYSHKQISELLNISQSTSKSQYHRARMLLRDAIKNKYI
jgi:RNA polymerase sigma factor (sigma-70 family)